MKICPECAFANEERFPTCVWCNTLLVNVPSTFSADPNHPEHAARALVRRRHATRRNHLLFALACYAAGITLLAVVPGLIFDPRILAGFAVIGCAVGFAMTREWVGAFTAMFSQGAATTALVVHLGLLNHLTGFMLLGHIVLPAIFVHWFALIDDGHL